MANTRSRLVLGVAAGSAAGAAGLTGLAALGAASYFARRIITPEQERPDDAMITSVETQGETPTITLIADSTSSAPGRYGLFFDGGDGHARIGEVVGRNPVLGQVTRVLDGVDRGQLRPGPGRWSGYYYDGTPWEALGLHGTEVLLEGELGELPAWVVPAAEPTERWAVLVHGRGALRQECLRALPVLHDLGITSLVPSYRNDPDAPASADGRYAMGLQEWHDVETAVAYALEQGAQEIILFGWSMGGSIVMQMLDRSDLAGSVSRVVLDSPALDWGDVIRHQAQVNRIPKPVGALGQVLMGSRATKVLVGLDAPVQVGLTDWVSRADSLHTPMLVMHSVEDEVVPYGPSEALAHARPDLVDLQEWQVAKHCRGWNTDPERWESAVRRFCADPSVG